MQVSNYVVDRNETVTNAAARGEAYDVRGADGNRVGMLSNGDRGWRILSAGYGVPFDQHTFHARLEAAVAALVDTVKTQTVDGALAIDESGLTKHQRDVLDFMGKYALSTRRKAAIWQLFDVSETKFMQEFNALLNNPAALKYAPMIVNRHRRLRDQMAANRSAKRLLPAGGRA